MGAVVLTVKWFRKKIWRIERAWSLLKYYWGTEDCDWVVAAELLQFQLKRIRLHIAKDNIIVDKDRVCRQLLITETILQRMMDEPYFDIAEKRYPNFQDNPVRWRAWAKMVSDLAEADDKMLGTMLGKYFRHWWD